MARLEPVIVVFDTADGRTVTNSGLFQEPPDHWSARWIDDHWDMGGFEAEGGVND